MFDMFDCLLFIYSFINFKFNYYLRFYVLFNEI